MSKPSACPFCGGPAMRSRKGKGSSSCCRSECYGGWIEDKTWESRPIEESLRVAVDAARAEAARVTAELRQNDLLYEAKEAEAARYRAALEMFAAEGCMRVDSDGQLRPCRTMASCPPEAWCTACHSARALEGAK